MLSTVPFRIEYFIKISIHCYNYIIVLFHFSWFEHLYKVTIVRSWSSADLSLSTTTIVGRGTRAIDIWVILVICVVKVTLGKLAMKPKISTIALKHINPSICGPKHSNNISSLSIWRPFKRILLRLSLIQITDYGKINQFLDTTDCNHNRNLDHWVQLYNSHCIQEFTRAQDCLIVSASENIVA